MSWLKSQDAHCPHLCTHMWTMGSFLTAVFFFLLLNLEVRHSCFSLHAEEFTLIATVSTWSHYSNLWHSEGKCNFRINGEGFIYICWNRESNVVTAAPGGQKFPPCKWWYWANAHFLRGIFPTGKNTFVYFPVRQLCVSLLSIITANLKCTVVLAASGDGWLRVLVISRVSFLGDKNPSSRSPSNTMTVRKSLIRCLI